MNLPLGKGNDTVNYIRQHVILRNALLVRKGAEEHVTAWQCFIGSEAIAGHFDQETICSKSIF